MDRKKIILTVAIIVIVAGIISLAMWIKNRPTKEQENFADKFTQAMQTAKNVTRVGTVESIDKESLTIRLKKDRTTVKLDEETVYSIRSKDQKDVKGKLADVKLNDVVSVEYDKATMRAVSVTLIKL